MSVRRGNIVVSHSEMIGPVVSSSSTLTYSASGYVVNPGNVSSFPWLSTFASNFDKYRILKLSYVFVSNQPTTIAGRVGLGFDYDSTDVLPGDRPEFYTLTHHVETPPWQSVRFDVPVESTVKFVNSHTVTDSKLIDAGQLIVMSDQIVGAVSNLGDVIVEYSVELLEPQQAVLQTQIFAGNNVTPFNLVASGPVLAKNVSSTAATTILSLDLPIGYYLINVVVQDTGLGTPSITGNGSSSGAGAINGRFTTSGGTAWQIYDLIANATINGARLTFTCALSWSALETAVVTVSRVSAPVYSGILSRYQNVLP